MMHGQKNIKDVIRQRSTKGRRFKCVAPQILTKYTKIFVIDDTFRVFV